MPNAPDPGFAALDATIAKAVHRTLAPVPQLDRDEHEDLKALSAMVARAVRDALLASGEIQWQDDSGDWPGVLVIPLGVGAAPDQHNTPHA